MGSGDRRSVGGAQAKRSAPEGCRHRNQGRRGRSRCTTQSPESIADAEGKGFTVADDLSITDASSSSGEDAQASARRPPRSMPRSSAGAQVPWSQPIRKWAKIWPPKPLS